ncbi:MAG: hypothetical protein WC501_00550 [Candidatus Micrarchaeia archaeon]
MADYISLMGLVLIAIGWLIQFFYMRDGKRKISNSFIIINCIGIIILIINAYLSGAYEIAFGNVLTFAAAFAVLYKIKN